MTPILSALLWLAIGAVPTAQAQLRLPGLPSVPAPPTPPVLPAPRLPELVSPSAALQTLRADAIRALLREHAGVLEADPAGEPIVRGELVLLAPTPAALAAARAQGFRVLRELAIDALELRSVVLAPPEGLGTADALARLRAIDASLEADFLHVYTRSGEAVAGASSSGAPSAAVGARRVGLIDSGIDRTHPALRAAELRTWGCEGAAVPSPHGTAVASLLVGRDAPFAGVLPRAALLAADVYCGRPRGGSVEQIALALAWLAREQVGVINISLVGPPNRLLELAVRQAAVRGHLIVAAVGNDGPAAPPLYPASYAEVVGVTGVAPSRRVLPEAAQGPQVAFAAPGSELAVAQPGSPAYAVARGTSFAAPLVAGLLAEALPAPDPRAAGAALVALGRRAEDLGAPGRDWVFGWGLVAERARVAPERLPSAAR
jgi:subtilisin family serine protease